MKTLGRTALALLLLCAAASAQQKPVPAPRPAAAAGGLDHERVARDWLAARGIDATTPSSIDVAKLIDEHNASQVVGAIDVRDPALLLGDKQRADQQRDVAVALVDLHVAFLDWAGARGD